MEAVDAVESDETANADMEAADSEGVRFQNGVPDGVGNGGQSG